MCGTFGSTSDGMRRSAGPPCPAGGGGFGPGPLWVARDQDDVGARGRLADLLHERRFERAGRRRVALVVDARHLLVARRDDPQLARRAAAVVGEHRAGADAGFAQLADEPCALGVVADEARDLDAAAE